MLPISRSARRCVAGVAATALAAAGAVALSASASAAVHLPLSYGLTANDRLVSFSVEGPGTTLSDRAITGLNVGDDVLGIDVRPATGQVYGLVRGTISDRLVVIDPATGAATQVGAALTTRLAGTSFGFDFNPAVDRIRVVSDADQNLRLHPDTGAVAAVDGTLAYQAGDINAMQNPTVTAAGYSDNIPGGDTTATPPTELYGIDTDRDTLVEQNPPNAGTLVTIGALGVDAGSTSGLDIAGSDLGSNRSYAVLIVGGTDALYTVNTDTGAATLVGAFTTASPVEDLALADSRFVIDATSSGTEGGNVTVRVTRTGDTRSAGSVNYSTTGGSAVAGEDFTATSGTLTFAAGETSKTFTVATLDDTSTEGAELFTVVLSAPSGNNAALGRSTSQVTITDNESGRAYGLTTGNAIVTFSVNTPGTVSGPVQVTGLQSGEDLVGIDVRPATGELYAVGSTSRVYVINPDTGAVVRSFALSVALNGTSFGVDFNPAVDRLRIVSNTGQNLRVVPDTGATTVDGPLSYATGDTNAGTTPRVAGAGYTNNTAGATPTALIDIDTATDSLVRQSPPNDGVLNTIGRLGVTLSDTATVGLDISSQGGAAFAVLNPDGTTGVSLYRVDLGTGMVRLLGQLQDSTIEDIALASVAAPGSSAGMSPSPSASPSTPAGPPATMSPPPGCAIASVRINSRTINATGLASVTVVGVRPGDTVDLQGYSQDHFLTRTFANDATPRDRSGVADSNGTVTFNDLRLSSNTRVRAQQRGCAFGNSDVINVRTQLTLAVARTAPRTYVISGKSIPARPGGLIVSLYQITGTPCAAGVEPRSCPGEVLIGQARADQVNGQYSFRKSFPASFAGKRINLVLKTGQDAQNAPGRSNVRSLLVL